MDEVAPEAVEREASGGRVSFGDFAMDLDTLEVWHGDHPVALPPKASQVLGMLVARGGGLVSRAEIRDRVWPATFVEFDQGLNTCIRQIRQALGDQAKAPVYIGTVPRRGYRLLATVSGAPTGSEDGGRRAAAVTHGSRRMWLLGGVAIMAAAAIVWSVRPSHPPRVAVLPFVTFDSGAGYAQFGGALTDEVTTLLARQDPAALAVIARTSAAYYGAQGMPVDQLGVALRVDYVVEGSIGRDAGGEEMTVRLIRVSDQAAVWSGTFRLESAADGDPAVAVADAVVRQILSNPALPPPEAPRDPSLRRNYLLAVHLLREETPEALREAVGLLEAVTVSDPSYPPGWVALAEALARSQRYPDAWAALAHAREGHAESAEGDRVRAYLELTQWHIDSAMAAIDRAVSAAPGDAYYLHSRAYVLVLAGRFDEAFREMERARQLDPVSAAVYADFGLFYFAAGRWADGLAHCAEAARFAPPSHRAYIDRCRLRGFIGSGQTDSTRRIAERLIAGAGLVANDESPTSPRGAPMFWHRVAEDSLRRLAVFGGGGPYARARAMALANDSANTLAALEQAVAERTPALIRLRIEPEFIGLRANPRFAAIVATIDHHGAALR